MGLIDKLKTATEAVRLVQDVAGTAANAEQNRKSAEAYKAVLDAYEAAIDLQAENVGLKQEIAELRDRRALRLALKRDMSVYYFDEPPPPGYHVGPYCSKCFDDDGKLITLRLWNRYETSLNWNCGKCTNMCSSSLVRAKAHDSGK